MKTILEDSRKIKGLFFNNNNESSYEAVHGCKITAYKEPGQYCYIPFFAIEINGEIVSRIPATMVEVCYET